MIWIGIILILLLLVLFSRIRIGLYYKREAQNDRLNIEIGLFNGLIPIRLKIPTLKVKDEGVVYKEEIQSKKNTVKKKKGLFTFRDFKTYERAARYAVENVVGLRKIIKRFLSKMQIIRLHWSSRIGTGDAAETGILSGVIWGIKSIIVWVLSHFMKMKVTPEIRIEPSFMQACLYTEFECIVRFRVGNAIIAGLLILLHIRKGSRMKWQNTQSKGL